MTIIKIFILIYILKWKYQYDILGLPHFLKQLYHAIDIYLTFFFFFFRKSVSRR